MVGRQNKRVNNNLDYIIKVIINKRGFGKMRVLSLFSGIGAFEKALKNINVDYELVGFSEIDKYAINSYCAIHNERPDKNLGDISKIDVEKLPKNIDLLTHGSPCTSYSIAGKGLGGDKGSGTPSSLMWYSVDIIKKVLPKVVVWENVANVLSPKHKHNFDAYLESMNLLGYSNYYTILNAKYFGVAQNRNRIICVSVYKTEDIQINFDDAPNTVDKVLKDIVEPKVEDRMILHRPMTPLFSKRKSDVISVGQSSNKGSQAGKVYSVDGLFPTVCACTHGYALGYIQDKGVNRKLTVLEVFRLMGFSDIDCFKCIEIGTSETQMYKQAGNSIVVPMLEWVFKKIYSMY